MKRIIYLFIAITIILGALNTSPLMAQNKWDKIINSSVEKLKKNKNNAAKIKALQIAYPEATAQDNLEIQKLIRQEENWNIISTIYQQMDLRQEKVFTVLPLSLNGQEVTYKKVDYKSKMLQAQKNAGIFHYKVALELSKRGTKKDFQYAYYHLEDAMYYLGKLDSLTKFQENCYKNGMYNVLIKCNNQISLINNDTIKKIEENLTKNTNGFWIKYFFADTKNTNLDFVLEINLKKFTTNKGNDICWGTTFYKDDKDCSYYHTIQTKNSKINYTLDYKYYNSNKIYYHPKGKRYIYEFSNIFANYIGEAKAIPLDLVDNIFNEPIELPNKKEMLKYTIEEFNNFLCQKISALEEKILTL